MKTILNRLILLLFLCALCIGVKILLQLISSKPFTSSDAFESTVIALVLWVANLLFSKGKFLKDWPFKNQ
jgi:hypothetical protein